MITSDLWAIDERWLGDLNEAIRRRRAGASLSELRAVTSAKTFKNRGAAEASGVMVLPIVGFIEKRQSWLGELFGSCSTQQLIADVTAAVAAKNVDGIVLLVDSPGGSVDGTEEAGDVIRNARGTKPIVSVVDGLAASAAYWLASQADYITLSPSGEAGSIGVFYLHESIARALDKEGVDVTLIRSTPFKAELNPYMALTAEAQKAVKERVDEVHRTFVRAVSKGRRVAESTVRANYGKGRTVSAADALSAGMIDGIAAPHEAMRLAASYIDRAHGAAELRGQWYELCASDLSVQLPKHVDADVAFLIGADVDRYGDPEAEDNYVALARLRLAEWEQSDREARQRAAGRT